MTPLFDGTLMADYHQFYLADEADLLPDPTPWTEGDVRRRILVEPGRVTLSTARDMPVPVRVFVHGAEPALDLAAADHAVEAPLRTSGTAVLAGCTDYRPDAARLALPPGPLRVLLVCTGLGTLTPDGLDGENRYDLHLWPADEAPVIVRRQWEE